jgi:hypothetical protein
MAVDPAGFFKLKYVYSGGGASVFPGMEGKITGTPTVAQLQDAVDAFGGFWQDRLSALTNPNWTLDTIRMIYSNGTIEELVESSVSVVGTLGSTTTMARSSCIVTGYSIASFYRGGKPRTYWPGLGRYESGSETHWQAALVPDFQTAVSDLLDDINGYTATGITAVALGCIRRVRLGSPIVPPEFFPYLSVHADGRICTQRRRLGPL